MTTPHLSAHRFPPWAWILVAIALLVLAAALFGCGDQKPAPRPDSTATPDTLVPDTATLDTAAQVEDSTDPVDDLPELTPEDTIITPEDSATVRARPRATVSSAGKATGLFRWPSEKWCDGPLTGSVEGISPKIVAGAVRKASYCGLRFFVMIRRSQVTNTGTTRGYFVLSKGKQVCDELARALPLEMRRQYLGRAILGIVIGDEMHSITWANRPARPADVAEYARYCKDKLSPLPILLRQPADNGWVREIAASQWSGVDYWWAQWNEKRGPRHLSGVAKQTAWYASETAAAARLGAGVILGFNTRDCDQQDDNYCTPSKVRSYGANATRLSKNCIGVLAWWYDPPLFTTAYREAWQDNVALAKSQPSIACEEG
jgi:hypothetical protein